MILLRCLQATRASRGSLCSRLMIPRSTVLPRISLTSLVIRGLSLNSIVTSTSTGAQSPKPNAIKKAGLAYPERLLIYHAGTGRTVFIGCLKVTTLFLFAFFALLIVPGYYYDPSKSNGEAVVYALLGAVPFVFVSMTTGPFATYVHLRLPNYARQSRELLTRYVRNLPGHAEMDITTMTIIGRPRVSRMPRSQLSVIQPRALQIENFIRSTQLEDRKRKYWFMPKAIGKFAIATGTGGRVGKAKESWAWDAVAKCIDRDTVRVDGQVVLDARGRTEEFRRAEILKPRLLKNLDKDGLKKNKP